VDLTRSASRLHPAWWATILIAVIVASVVLSVAVFNRALIPRVPVTLTADRVGLVMDPGGKVKLRGVEVGTVAAIKGGRDTVSLNLEIDPDQIRYIPANVEAQIAATTAFGNKYVELIYPENPSSQRLSRGQVLRSRNVSIEVNTVLENLVKLLDQVDPAKLNAILTTLADGLRGQGERIGEAITDTNELLTQINPRSETVRADFQALGEFSDAYGVAAQDILATLDALNTTGPTITNHAKALESLLLNVTGLANSGIDLLGPNKDNLVNDINKLEPTTRLLHKYNPEYTCMLVGAKWALDHGAYYTTGGHNGYSLIADAGILLGNDPYVYPDNLPIVAAKGGPGGKPGCGSLPDPTKQFPVRQLVTNTGWGTGMDVRDNVGLGHPCYANWFPVTRAVPEPPSIRCQGPPSPGLVVPAGGPFGPPMNAWPTVPAPPQAPPASDAPAVADAADPAPVAHGSQAAPDAANPEPAPQGPPPAHDVSNPPPLTP
jgi:phospholipid/cholesterol/gamma-HCH transport system substrate-binding protein